MRGIEERVPETYENTVSGASDDNNKAGVDF